MSQGESIDRVAKRLKDGSWKVIKDSIAVEAPLQVKHKSQSLMITMRTPGHDEELVLGFFLTEGIIQSPQEIRLSIPSNSKTEEETVVEVFPKKGTRLSTKALQRYGTIHSSCGICGKQSMDEVMRGNQCLLNVKQRISLEGLLEIPNKFSGAQSLFQTTGGLHAAALFDPLGNLLVLREDVGRHNAVDKVVGWTAQNDCFRKEGQLLMISGRISYEIVQKAIASKISILMGVSAPSSLAIKTARKAGLTLIGFCRPPQVNVYSHIESIIMKSED